MNSKLDANLLSISPDRTNPVFLVNKALRMYAAELQNASIETTLSIDDSLQQLEVEDVILDSSRLLQVMINLLTNAISKSFDLSWMDTSREALPGSAINFVRIHADDLRIYKRPTKARDRDINQCLD